MPQMVPSGSRWSACFHAISPKYDFLNRLFSMGTDQGWRRKVMRLVAQEPVARLLDVATGTAQFGIDGRQAGGTGHRCGYLRGHAGPRSREGEEGRARCARDLGTRRCGRSAVGRDVRCCDGGFRRAEFRRPVARCARHVQGAEAGRSAVRAGILTPARPTACSTGSTSIG